LAGDGLESDACLVDDDESMREDGLMYTVAIPGDVFMGVAAGLVDVLVVMIAMFEDVGTTGEGTTGVKTIDVRTTGVGATGVGAAGVGATGFVPKNAINTMRSLDISLGDILLCWGATVLDAFSSPLIRNPGEETCCKPGSTEL
jgi:hypothetical protein